MENNTTIAIIGAGPLGRSLALRAARAGFRVFLEDVMPSNLHHAQELIREQLSPEGMAASLAESDPAGLENAAFDGPEAALRVGQEVSGRDFSPAADAPNFVRALAPAKTIPVTFVSTVEDAVRSADLVIDCVPDELESKLEILWLLDRMAPPHTVFATPTTTQSIADLAACTYRPGKCVAIAAAPAALARSDGSDGSDGSSILLRTTAATAPETIDLVRRFWSALGFQASFECVQ